MAALVHTLAHHWATTDVSDEGFLCVCGDLFVNEGEKTKWEPPILQFSDHLKKMNVESDLVSQARFEEDIYREAADLLSGRGNNDLKPEKPEGDDPRAGHEIITSNGWRRWFGLK